MEVKFGKWRDHATAVKNLVSEKLQFHYFAQKQELVKGNSEKYGLLFFITYYLFK